MPLPTVDEFVALHPQFAQVAPDAISQAILDAADFVSEAVYGAQYVHAIRMKTCSLLATEMYGQQPTVKGDEPNPYEKKFEAIKKVRVPRQTVT